MKPKLYALALLLTTALVVAFYPALIPSGNAAPTPDPEASQAPSQAQRPRIEAAFVLDTTGSMGGLIQAAKEKIWSIASTMAAAQPAPEVRIGLVAYRDRGDAYVTRVVDLSGDLDTVYAQLMDFQANGGGDGPESVNQALHDALHRLSWSQDPRVYRVIFLVGDAPPHMDYANEVQWPQTVEQAAQRGIRVNAIQCGQVAGTTATWQRIARVGGGDYFQVEQSGSAVAIATPYDAPLAEVARSLDETRLYYGDAEDKARQAAKLAATEKVNTEASVASRARRATFNTSESGKASFLGEKELVEAVTTGRVELDSIDPEELPAPVRALAPEQQRAVIEETAERRKGLEAEARELAAKRDAWLRERVAERGDAEDTLDHKVFRAVREQAAGVGLSYGDEGPAY